MNSLIFRLLSDLRSVVLIVSAIVCSSVGVHALAVGQTPCLDPSIPKPDYAGSSERWKQEWKNPRLMLDIDGVFLLLGGGGYTGEQKPLGDVQSALCALPCSAWPEGRIVAVTLSPRLLKTRTDDAGRRVVDAKIDDIRKVLDALGVDLIDTPVGCNCS